MNYKTRYFNTNQIEKYKTFVLGIDIGGTNTNLAIAGIENKKPFLIFSLDFKSQEINSIVPAINATLGFAKENYNIKECYGCIGAAGVVDSDQKKATLTNVEWDIDTDEIIKNTNLKKVFIINDFQAIGYGINLLDHNNSNDIVKIKSGEYSNKNIKAIIGAGTGLGKSILFYDDQLKSYISLPSEGGHSDFPITNDEELELSEFIKDIRNILSPICYEELLSGRGIEGIYSYLKNKKKYKTTIFTKEIESNQDKTPLISKYRKTDEACSETFSLFTKFYARCAKNYVLDTMATGGLYIAGGIAIKNKEIFLSKEFISEFEDSYTRSDILKSVPIYLIVNYDVSIYGACLAAYIKFFN